MRRIALIAAIVVVSGLSWARADTLPLPDRVIR